MFTYYTEALCAHRVKDTHELRRRIKQKKIGLTTGWLVNTYKQSHQKNNNKIRQTKENNIIYVFERALLQH